MTRIRKELSDRPTTTRRGGLLIRRFGVWLSAVVLGAAVMLPTLGGCASKAQTGALIGAGAGAAGGYIIGNELDKQDMRDHHHHH